MNQQVATKIYLPNPKADYRQYLDGFKVNEDEYKIIKVDERRQSLDDHQARPPVDDLPSRSGRDG
ncbi:hypothetical protein [Xanthomonas vasicola]|uniref:hypothetical protein n=1 Tax=Xanthomonas vasicola TaxID=56459 RepID=UPI000344E3DE|nr:hypothetical protein [Xanthomonas vasicola]MDO6949560.1 hypothetical protein [Xanthomonas vasicola]MDO6961845.1 hypothetical protein [Xanthomonas vasicola]MDO6970771.1 hypothetical protein [Xanthomonas vasicola]